MYLTYLGINWFTDEWLSSRLSPKTLADERSRNNHTCRNKVKKWFVSFFQYWQYCLIARFINWNHRARNLTVNYSFLRALVSLWVSKGFFQANQWKFYDWWDIQNYLLYLHIIFSASCIFPVISSITHIQLYNFRDFTENNEYRLSRALIFASQYLWSVRHCNWLEIKESEFGSKSWVRHSWNYCRDNKLRYLIPCCMPSCRINHCTADGGRWPSDTACFQISLSLVES